MNRKKTYSKTIDLIWCAWRDSNPHGRPPEPKSGASASSATSAYLIGGDPTGNRTRVTAVKGRCLNRLTMGPYKKTGDVLISQAASHQVSSALKSLTSVFGMGTGVTSLLLSPDYVNRFRNLLIFCSKMYFIIFYAFESCTLKIE